MPPRATSSSRFAFLLALGVACLGCRTEPRVYVLDDGVKMAADGRLLSLVRLPGYLERNPAWDGRVITLAGARGETVAFQVVTRAGDAALHAVDARLGELRGEGGAVVGPAAAARFRVWYVPVAVPSVSPGGSAGPGDYPDALVPANAPRLGLPVDVPKGRSQAIWFDLAIPRAARAGAYRGTLEVTAAGRTLARLGVVLAVRDFTLPPERHLPWRMGYSGFGALPARLGVPEGSAAWLELERDLYRLVWEGHRAAPTTHYHLLRLPLRGVGQDLSIDWTDYDRRFGAYLDGSAFADRVPVGAVSLPLNPFRGWPVAADGDPAALDTATLRAVARLTARHWDEKGWRLADAFAYVADEPPPDRYEVVGKACDAIREGDPRIVTSVAFYTEFGAAGPDLARRFGGRLGEWMIAGDQADLPALRARRLEGDRVGVYQGGEPYLGGEALDGDGLALTTWPWIAWRYGLDALLLYDMTEWSYARLDRSAVPWAKGKREIWENPLNQSWQTNSQGVLVYPGDYAGIRGVVPSVRLKQVRRGLQDYEYLWLAAQRGARPLADAVARRLVPSALHDAGPPGGIGPPGTWERDPRRWAGARSELAAAIEAAGR